MAVASIPGEGGLAGGGGWVLEQEDIELYLLVDRIGVGDGRRGSSAASSAGWRPWRATAASLARGQGLGLALGDAEQMRSEARRPGTRRIAAGRRRMAGAEGDGARVRSVPLDCSVLTRWRDERGSEIELGDRLGSGECLCGGRGHRRDAWRRKRRDRR